MKMPKTAALIVIIQFLVVFLVLAQQQERYVIGVENTRYFPLYDHDNQMEYIGYARAILDEFAKEYGYQFEYRILPVKRLFGEFLIEGSALDLKFPDNPYWSSDDKQGKQVIYSQSVVKYIDGVMMLPENMHYQLDQIMVLGTVRGFTAWDYLESIKSGKITVSENGNFTGLLKQVLLKRVDGAYANITVAKYQLSEVLKQPDSLKFNANLPHTKSSYYLSTIKHPKIIENMNDFLLEKSELVNSLKEKYKVENL